MRLSPQSVARWSARRRFTVIGIWVGLFLVGGLLTSSYLSGALTTQADFTNNPDSKQAQQLLEQRLSGPRRSNEVVIVRSDSKTVTDPQFKAYVQRLKGDLDALKPAVVQQATDPYQAGDRFVSDDRHATLIPVTMAGSLDDADKNIDRVLDRTLHAPHPEGFKVWVAGEATAAKDANTIAEQDLRQGETIGIVAALIILIVVFGAAAAAVVPVVLAIMAIVVALGLVSLLGLAFDLSFFVTNMITMIGLAVGIDYSLFTVSRYREERARGRDKLAAIGAAGGTANRAVFFSGMTVVLALAAMLVNPTTIFRSIAAGAIVVVLVAVTASLTLLPALLAVMGDRVNALRVPVLFRRRQDPRGGGGSGQRRPQQPGGHRRGASPAPGDHPSRLRRGGRACQGRRADRGWGRLFRPDPVLHAVRDRVRAGLVVCVAAGGVPLGGAAGAGGGAEPAVGGRRLRAAGVGVPARTRRGPVRLPTGRHHRVVAAAVFVLGAVRAVHGLPGVFAQPHPGTLRPHQRQPRRGRVRAAHHRRDHHRRRGDHGGGVRGVCGRPAADAAADGLRPGGGGADRRHPGALGAGPRGHDPAGQVELVPATLAWLAAAAPHRGHRPNPSTSRARARAAAGALTPTPRGSGGARSPRTHRR